jgi:transcriptional regulator with XRE-family HTH domain
MGFLSAMDRDPRNGAVSLAGSGRIVGRQINSARLERNLTRRDLGDMLGVSSEQVERYETGEESVPAGKLYRISELFGLPVTDFFKQPD